MTDQFTPPNEEERARIRSVLEGRTPPDIQGRWSNGNPVHLIVDGKGGRRVAPNHNGATWIPADA